MWRVYAPIRDMYRNELWGLTPTNPASMKSPLIKYILLDEEGKKERSSLSFSCLLMLCVGKSSPSPPRSISRLESLR